MKHQRSEKALNFIKQKKDFLIVVGIVAVVIVLALLSFNYLKEQKQNNARIAFGKALSVQENSESSNIEDLRTISQEYNGSSYATYSLMLLGIDQMNKGEYREAIASFDAALKSKQTAAFLTAQLWGLKATALEFDGSIDEAISSFQKALNVSGNLYMKNEIRLKAAFINLKVGQNAQAKELFEEIVADSTASDNIIRIAKNEIAALEY